MSKEMTREQACDTLRNAAWLGTNEDRERIERAVELLCGEPCEDAISRQAMHIELEKWITYGEYKYSNATKYLYDRIDRLPSVTPKQTEITLESAIDYLHKIGWLQRHDKEMTKFVLSVTPKQRTGHWNWNYDENMLKYAVCSACGWDTEEALEYAIKYFKHCPNCAAKMVDPQERSE